jgi:hypothetical protein
MDDGLMTGLTSITLTVIAHGTGVIDYASPALHVTDDRDHHDDFAKLKKFHSGKRADAPD